MTDEHMIDDPTETEAAGSGLGRRDFLKRSALTGAVAWSAPTVLSLPGGAAWAQTYCCSAEADGLIVRVPDNGDIVNVDLPGGPNEYVLDTGEGGIVLLGGIEIRVQVITARTDEPQGGPCTAVAEIANLSISGDPLGNLDPIQLRVLTAEGSAPCPPCNGGTTADTSILELTLGSLGTPPPLLDLSACNLTVDLSPIVKLDIGKQVCEGNTLTASALELVLLDGLAEVIASRVRLTSRECPCETCGDGNNLLDLTGLLDGVNLNL